jgi:rod shape determining protein RodA
LADILHLDLWLFAMLVVLGLIGLATVYSATGSDTGALISQAQRLGIGLAALLIVARCPPQWFHGIALPGYALCLCLLIAVHLLGVEVNGSQRWLSVAGIRLQPSELMKIVLPLALAAVLAPARWPLGWGLCLVAAC